MVLIAGCQHQPPPPSATSRALDYLQREVPAWKKENGCFSCHNNGDGARALVQGAKKGYTIRPEALKDTIGWLKDPTQWDHNQGDPGFSDQRLADIQFGLTLMASLNLLRDEQPLLEAARRIARQQNEDGSWPIEAVENPGSPTTYGATLATWLAWRVLNRADSEPEASSRAEKWLGAREPKNVPAAAALLLAHATGIRTKVGLTDCVAFLTRAQTSEGGWGPYPDSPAETFDTALALMALARLRGHPLVEKQIAAGRAYLKKTQHADGSWSATTRPPGGESYAQHISTTAWAAQALMATDD